MTDHLSDDSWDRLADANDLLAQVKAVRRIAEVAARGDAEAAAWLSSRMQGLAKLLAEVEAALTASN
jgi:hypothetical protein